MVLQSYMSVYSFEHSNAASFLLMAASNVKTIFLLTQFEAGRTCQNGRSPPYRRHGNTCILLDRRTRNWDSSRRFCQGLRGDLVKADSSVLNNYLKTLIGATESGWIGLRRDPRSRSRWLWRDNTRVGRFCLTFF